MVERKIISEINDQLFFIVLLVKFPASQLGDKLLQQLRIKIKDLYAQLLYSLKKFEDECLEKVSFGMGYIIHRLFYTIFVEERKLFNIKFVVDCYSIIILELFGAHVTDFYIQQNIEKFFSFRFLDYQKSENIQKLIQPPRNPFKVKEAEKIINSLEVVDIHKTKQKLSQFSFLAPLYLHEQKNPGTEQGYQFSQELKSILNKKSKSHSPRKNKQFQHNITNEKNKYPHIIKEKSQLKEQSMLESSVQMAESYISQVSNISKQNSSKNNSEQSLKKQKFQNSNLPKLLFKRIYQNNGSTDIQSNEQQQQLSQKLKQVQSKYAIYNQPKEMDQQIQSQKKKKVIIETQLYQGDEIVENIAPCLRVKAMGSDISSNRQRFNLNQISPNISETLGIKDQTLQNNKKQIIFHPIDRVLTRKNIEFLLNEQIKDSGQKIKEIEDRRKRINQQQQKGKTEGNIQEKSYTEDQKYYLDENQIKKQQPINVQYGIKTESIVDLDKYKYDQYKKMLQLKAVLDNYKQNLGDLNSLQFIKDQDSKDTDKVQIQINQRYRQSVGSVQNDQNKQNGQLTKIQKEKKQLTPKFKYKFADSKMLMNEKNSEKDDKENSFSFSIEELLEEDTEQSDEIIEDINESDSQETDEENNNQQQFQAQKRMQYKYVDLDLIKKKEIINEDDLFEEQVGLIKPIKEEKIKYVSNLGQYNQKYGQFVPQKITNKTLQKLKSKLNKKLVKQKNILLGKHSDQWKLYQNLLQQ